MSESSKVFSDIGDSKGEESLKSEIQELRLRMAENLPEESASQMKQLMKENGEMREKCRRLSQQT